jgi:hypothetical protein
MTLTLNWYKFKLDEDDTIVSVEFYSNSGHDVAGYMDCFPNNYITARDELDAYTWLTRWIAKGKPLEGKFSKEPASRQLYGIYDPSKEQANA